MAKTIKVNSNIQRIMSILLLAVVSVAGLSQAKSIRRTLRVDKVTITLPENIADASRTVEEQRQDYDKQTLSAGSAWQTTSDGRYLLVSEGGSNSAIWDIPARRPVRWVLAALAGWTAGWAVLWKLASLIGRRWSRRATVNLPA